MKKHIFILASLPVLVYSLIEEDIMPKMLQDCYSTHVSSYTNELEAQNNCLKKYMLHVFGNATYLGLDQNALKWVDSLGRRIHIRIKRQSRYGYGGNRRYGGYNRRRVRKEIRTLTDRDRDDFFAAINALKNDKSQKPNKYDAFALLHQSAALPSAHGGPNFVSWHRYYILLFEEALRTKKRNVALPYWDSTLDFRMADPVESVLWTEIFLGNPKGIVYTGPFASWRTPAQNTYLRRDIPGPESSLIDPEKIKNVFEKHYHREILSPTAASDLDNLERHHDGVHRWVGGRDGHMGGLDTSPQDPVFWLHHCYVDYLWEKFREKQRRNRIDSETDYPETEDEYHQPNRIMDNLLPSKRNIEGYSDTFTRNIYRYAPAPTCRNRCGGGYNGFLYCDWRTYKCKSRTRRAFVDMDGFSNVESQYVSHEAIGVGSASVQGAIQPSIAGRPDGAGGGIEETQTTATTPTVFRAELNPGMTNVNAAPSISRGFARSIIDSRTITTTRKRRSMDSSASDNIGDLDSSIYTDSHPTQWVAMPITITSEHTTRQRSQNEKSSPSINGKMIFNITLQTVGFSYNGRHTDYIYVDDRTSFSKSNAFVAFEKPIYGETRAYVRVHDFYGGVCRPECLVSQAHKLMYRNCTGVIKVTQDLPLMYLERNDLEDVENGVINEPFIRFHCKN